MIRGGKRLNQQLGIATKKRRRKLNEESKTTVKRKTDCNDDQLLVKRKRIVILDETKYDEVTLRDILKGLFVYREKVNACGRNVDFQGYESGIVDIICSFSNRDDAIRFRLMNVFVARVRIHLDCNRRFFEEVEVSDELPINVHTQSKCETLWKEKHVVKHGSHRQYCDWYFANCLFKVMLFGDRIKWWTEIMRLQDAYSKERHWTGFRHPSFSEEIPYRIGFALGKCVQYAIQKDMFAEFQWLLEQYPVGFQPIWLSWAIAFDRLQFVEHILFKYQFHRQSTYSSCARSTKMMDMLKQHKFKFNGYLMHKYMERYQAASEKNLPNRMKRELEKMTWLLAKRVAQPRHQSYLTTALFFNCHEMIRKLAEFGFGCPNIVFQKVLLSSSIVPNAASNLTTVQLLYDLFYKQKMLFLSSQEHEAFLTDFLMRLRQIDVVSNSIPICEVLQWMDVHHPTDLSYALLYSVAISLGSIDHLDFLLKQGFNDLNMNHVDQAMLQPSTAVFDWVLSKNVPCSQSGMEQLMNLATFNNHDYRERVKRILSNQKVSSKLFLLKLPNMKQFVTM